MDACTIGEHKAHPQAIILYFRSEDRASFHYSKLVMIQLCPSCKLHTVSRLIFLLSNKKVLNNISTAAATISLGPSKGDN